MTRTDSILIASALRILHRIEKGSSLIKLSSAFEADSL